MYNYCPVLQKCLHPTLWIRKMPTYKVVHSEYFCATMIVLQQFIISGRHGFKATTLRSPRPFRPCLSCTRKNTNKLHALTPRQVGRPGRKLGGFERHLLTRSDPCMLFELANCNVCVIELYCHLSEKLYTTTTASPSSYGTQSVKRITTIELSRISLYPTNHTAETLVLELTFCALQMVVIYLVHQYHIAQTVNRSSSVIMG
jgi:hypothetical protein